MKRARQSGILLHITSLPGPLPNGVLGREAVDFMEKMAAAGSYVWQILPVGPTHGHGSPYETLSTFAGNPQMIDLRICVDEGLLDASMLQQVCDGAVTMAEARASMVTPFRRHWLDRDDWQQFLVDNGSWLDDFALFVTIKQLQSGRAWWQWSKPLRSRDGDALAEVVSCSADLLLLVKMEQFLFDRQWQKMRETAASLGITLLGDLPIYVAHDSVDVWANRHLFTVNGEGVCDEVAGVPPDYFSATGQRWGNPLYRWDILQESGFAWWVERVRRQHARVDSLRIDHFRGLEAYWAIPGEQKDGRVGEWRKAPGEALLHKVEEELGVLPLIAEDLGLITDEVHALRTNFALPGMKVLQFAFGGGADNPYLPHNHTTDMVVYTGTHDNDTTLGWWQQQGVELQEHLRHYFGMDDGATAEEVTHQLVRQAVASVADIAIIPLQDLLLLDSSARLNTPGTVEGNWSWRVESDQLDCVPWQQLQRWNHLYGRGAGYG
ncbi:MAG: 4-alpha-glucanotransferase [Mariprofundales bacterium]|nr:4-alpha-glucanotransferase [Mariprofundales bacterium]